MQQSRARLSIGNYGACMYTASLACTCTADTCQRRSCERWARGSGGMQGCHSPRQQQLTESCAHSHINYSLRRFWHERSGNSHTQTSAPPHPPTNGPRAPPRGRWAPPALLRSPPEHPDPRSQRPGLAWPRVQLNHQERESWEARLRQARTICTNAQLFEQALCDVQDAEEAEDE